MSDEIIFFADDGFEERHAARQARVKARLKRQRRMQKIFFGSIGLIIVAIIAVVIIVNVNKNKAKDPDSDYLSADAINQITDNPDLDNSDSDDLSGKQEAEQTEPTTPVYGYTDLYGNGFITDRKSLIDFDASEFFFTSSADMKGMTAEDYYSEYGIMVNLNEKSVIASKDGYAKIYPASMTKILTVLTAKRYIADSELDNEVCVTMDATDYSFSHGCSTAGFKAGEIVTVRDLFYGTILPSGAEAAYMLAIYVSGSQEEFVKLMT